MSFLQDTNFSYCVINVNAAVMGTMPHRRVWWPLLTRRLRPDSCKSFWDALPEAQDQKKTNGQQLVLRSLVRVRANGDGGNWALTICLLLQISSQVVRRGISQINDFSQGKAPPASGYVQTLDCSKLKNTSHRRLGSLVKHNQANL